MTYVPLGVRTEYSFLDGMCRIEPLVERARALRFDALGIGDLHSAFGLVRFYVAAHAVGVRPILGVRVHLQPDSPGEPSWGNVPPEVLLVAADTSGFRNLLRLTSLALRENGGEGPGVTLEDLDRWRAGILALDGGHEGPVCRTLLQGGPREAERVAAHLRHIFGPERFFIQLQRHAASEEAAVEPFILRLARGLNIPVVASNDTRYLDADEAAAHQILRRSARHDTPAGRTEPAADRRQHLRSGVEMQRLFGDVPEALENTRLVAERCQVDLDLGGVHLPTYRAESGRDPSAELQLQCERGACGRYTTTRYQDVPVTVRDRIAHELAVIEEKKLASCFLIVQDVVRKAKGEGVPIGPGRGNVAGSLVAYALGITEIDPLQHGLLFEPFLSRGGPALPELDLDIGSRGREPLLRYLRRRYGHDRVAHLSTVATFGLRRAVRVAGRVLGYTADETESLVTALGPGPVESLQVALEHSGRLRSVYQESARARDLLETAARLAGMAHHAVPSPGGLVFAPGPLDEHVALDRAAGGEVTAQATHADAAVLGLMQLHLCGLRYLSVEQETMQHVEQRGGKRLGPTGDGLDDEPTYRMLAHGTTVSVFHLERPGMQALLREMQPARFEDIVAALSLNRPAMRGLGVAERYLAYKRSGDAESLAQPELHEALGGGPLLHQEQLMQAAVRLAGFDLEAAESLRSAIRRRSWSELAGHRGRFLSGALDRGIELERGEEIFDLLVGLGPSTDVRAHTVAYALLAYRSAYLATHHPVEYCLALLNHCVGEPERMERILADAIDRRIRILDVDINRSGWRCELAGGAIRMGLLQVRGLAETEAERIVADRRAHGPYSGLEEFSLRMGGLGKRALAALVRAGAFAGVGVARTATAQVGTRRSRDRKVREASPQLELGLIVGCGEARPLDAGSEPEFGAMLERGVRGTRRRGVSRAPRRPGRVVERVPRLWVAGQIRSSPPR